MREGERLRGHIFNCQLNSLKKVGVVVHKELDFPKYERRDKEDGKG